MSRPRRVLFVAWAPFFSGAERALVLTLRALDRTRYDPAVLVGSEGDFAVEVRGMGIPCQIAPLVPLERSRPLVGARSIGSVLGAAFRHRAALIHVNESPSFQPAGYAARALGIPALLHVRFPDSQPGFRWFLKPGFARALFVSQGLLREAMGTAPDVFADRADVLHDAVAPQPEWADEEIARERRALGLPIERRIVALTGQIAEVKGIWDFVAAAEMVARQSDAFFAVLGDDLKTAGALRRAMEERVAALGLTDRFKFLGFRKDAPRLVQAFDVIAVPSHVEPLGNATLEAMAAGRPVIGSRVGGIPEMVIDGGTGLLVPAAQPLQLAEAIARVVTDDALRRRLSHAARRRAVEEFGLEVHGARLQRHFDEVLSGVQLAQSKRGLVA